MTAPRQAILVAPGSELAEATRLAFAASCDVVEVSAEDFLQGRGDASQSSGSGENLTLVPDILVIGSSIFPSDQPPDVALKHGMQKGFLVVKSVLRGMMRRRAGRIIAVPPSVASSAAVGSLSGFLRSVAREAGSRGITANVVVPSHYDGDSLSPYIAMGRAMMSPDLAAALRFLASEDADYFTGQVLWVDGGLGAA